MSAKYRAFSTKKQGKININKCRYYHPCTHITNTGKSLFINKSGKYYFTENICGGSEEIAIVIQGRNIVLDLNGFSLHTSPSNRIGIYIAKGSRRISILNGSLIKFPIYAIFSDARLIDVRLRSLIFEENANVDVNVDDEESASIHFRGDDERVTNPSSGLTILDCVIRGMRPDKKSNGIYLESFDNVLIQNCLITDCKNLYFGIFTFRCSVQIDQFVISKCEILQSTIFLQDIFDLAKLNTPYAVKNCMIADNRFIGDSVFPVIYVAHNGTIQNCQVLSNFFGGSINIFESASIMNVIDSVVNLNECANALIGISKWSFRSSHVSNFQFSNNTAKQIKLISILSSTDIPIDKEGMILIENTISSTNIAESYNFITINQFEEANSSAKVICRGCSSVDNRGIGASYDTRLMINSLIENCLSSNGDIGYLYEGDNKVTFLNNKSIYDKVGIVGQDTGNSTFIGTIVAT